MKKLLTPVIHGSLLLPLTAVAVGTEMLAGTVGLLPPYTGSITTPLALLMCSVILLAGIPTFWFGNKFLQHFEKLPSASVRDHIRQCLFFYLILLWSTWTWASRGFTGNEDDGYLLIWSGFSVVGIVVNWISLFPRKGSI